MTQTIIQVQNLSKKYRLSEGGYTDSMREMLSDTARRWGRKLIGRGEPPPRKRDFMALDDINFEVRQGDVVGIIGHNGAGKSTLLKILSRITDPTSGQAQIWGRVGSLLEVGTGFHPELTGRENIFLNGSILGMTPGEIKSKFDEIVDFAEVEQFLDMPVKRYSSGMYVRLAFAVAANLQPEVLIVDEVLAVGDVKFQNKCLGKMKDVASHGRTILFVSHNMAAVQAMCNRGIVLHHGKLHRDCGPEDAVNCYLDLMSEQVGRDLTERTDRTGDGTTRVIGLHAQAVGKPANTLATGDSVTFEMQVDHPVPEMTCTFIIHDHYGQAVFVLRNLPVSDENDHVDTSLGDRIVCEIDQLPLVPGQYRVDYVLARGRAQLDAMQAAINLTVLPGQLGGRLVNRGVKQACVTAEQRWRLPR